MKVDPLKVAPDNWTEAHAMLVNIGAKLYTHQRDDEDLVPGSREKAVEAQQTLQRVRALFLELSDDEQEREGVPAL